MKLRVIFAGTPQFAVPTLEKLLEYDCDVLGVLTQPDRKKGRGRQLSAPPVKTCALGHSIPVFQTDRMDEKSVRRMMSLEPHMVIVVAFGLILPPRMLFEPPLGCINVHASLLPRWRGAAPIARAIEAGDSQTGVTIMLMNEGLDTGDMYSQKTTPIEEGDTTATLEERLATIGADELIRVLPMIMSQRMMVYGQNDRLATYARKMGPQDGVIDWHASATSIVNKIRACNPWPVANSWLNGQRLRIWEASASEPDTDSTKPGTVLPSERHQLIVAAGQGAVHLKSVQRDGKKRMPIKNFLAGTSVSAGSEFSDGS